MEKEGETKSAIYILGRESVILCTSIFIGCILMILVYALPEEPIYKNVQHSTHIFEEEGIYPILTKWCTSQLDNYTDAVMLLNSLYDGEESNVEKAMLGYRKALKDRSPVESLIEYSNNKTYDETITYARYWHGYLVYLKPLLMFFDYGTLRIINLVIQTVLCFIVLFMLYRMNMKGYIIPYLISLALIMPITNAFSLQFSDEIYVFSIGIIILLYKNEKWKLQTQKYCYLFLILGIITSFVDLLIYPLATFGIPATVYFCMNKTDNRLKNINNMLKLLFSWGIGYIGMWFGKWVLATILTKKNVIMEALDTIAMRTSMSDATGNDINIVKILYLNIVQFVKNPIFIIAFLFVTVMIFKIIKNHLLTIFLDCFIVFGILCILPFVWYVGASNHSYIHNFFTYKELIITAFAGMCMLVKTWEIGNIQKRNIVKNNKVLKNEI